MKGDKENCESVGFDCCVGRDEFYNACCNG